ncbi:unnamed protein product [Rodentolepis nana]|uniref:BPTI/Kunitz inhibitor domain-containing protein n=1 Tax=Rodentolepis nana TaxID=102285 RepID=A0A0R3TT27_RODNA|nr:unnamed protein product [Rodentolepis nana]
MSDQEIYLGNWSLSKRLLNFNFRAYRVLFSHQRIYTLIIPFLYLAVCNQPIKRGNCLAYFPSWAFDKSVGRCVPFVYGGCGGNGNRFRNIEECENACSPSVRMASSLTKPICTSRSCDFRITTCIILFCPIVKCIFIFSYFLSFLLVLLAFCY